MHGRIDVHAHYFPTPYLDVLDRVAHGEMDTAPGRHSAWPTRDDDLTYRLATMDRAGVDRQILSIATSGPYLRDANAAIAAARTVNDEYATVTRLHPTRLSAFACLPLPHIDAALAELTRALDDLGMCGVGISTTMGGKTLADPAFEPVYAELNRRAAILFIHPAGRSCESPLLDATALTWPLGAPFEDSVAALQFLQIGFSARYPNVRVIMPHLGGTLPFLVARLDHQASRFMRDAGIPSVELRKFWYDTVNGHPAALRCACDTFGTGRLLLGTDYPFWRDDAHDRGVAYINDAGLEAAEIEAITAGNAAKLFASLLPTG